MYIMEKLINKISDGVFLNINFENSEYLMHRVKNILLVFNENFNPLE